MKVLINSTKSHLTKINLILSKILGASFYSERSWSDLFSIFCARVTKLRKFSKNTRSLNLLREAKLLRRKERYYYKLQSIQQSFQSKITRSDIFPQSFARAAKLLRRKDRYFYKLQSIFKSFQSKNTRSLNLLRALQNY